MSEQTKIQWADHTFNPWIGCTKVSTGCANCYAEVSTPSRTKGIVWGNDRPRHHTAELTWGQPKAWDHFAAKSGTRPRVFPSLCDPFDDEVPIEWLLDFLELVQATPHLDWLLLTKRPQDIARRVREATLFTYPKYWTFRDNFPHVWLGVSAESQEWLDRRAAALFDVPAAHYFLSAEPLLGGIDLAKWFRLPQPTTMDSPAHMSTGFDWVIVGGESIGGRPCNMKWIRNVIAQGRKSGVPVFVKQLGSNPIVTPGPITIPCTHPKGGDMTEWPNDLRVREFPAALQQPTHEVTPS